MYSTQKIVHVVNSHLHDIEHELHIRSSKLVFTKGNCGIMPSFYAETGVDAIPYFWASQGISSSLPFHIMPEISKNVYDITCDENYPVIDITKWELLGVPDEKHIQHASYNFDGYGTETDKHREIRQKTEKLRMVETRNELLKRLSKHGMLRMKRNPDNGLYVPNESCRQP